MRKKFVPGLTVFDIYCSLTIHLSRMGLKRLPTFFMMTIMISVILIDQAMAVHEVLCKLDSECSTEQYCYDVSHRCVDYTRCSRYNRQEGENRARSQEQCGPCLAGYIAELLATGTQEGVCKKISSLEGSVPSEKQFDWWIYISIGILLAAVILGLSVLFIRKRFNEHGTKVWFKKMRGWSFTPSAPPPDNGAYHLQTFYNDEEPPIYSAVMNNNINAKDRNNLVTAVPCNPPSWVHVDQNYGHDDPDNALSITGSTPIQIEDEDTTPSTWAPEELNISVPSRPFQFASEQRDNVLNNLVRRDCGSTSESGEESTSGSTPRATGNSRNNEESYRGPSVQINQMITLNMVNRDH